MSGKAFFAVDQDFCFPGVFYKFFYLFSAHKNLIFNTFTSACPFGFSHIDGDPQKNPFFFQPLYSICGREKTLTQLYPILFFLVLRLIFPHLSIKSFPCRCPPAGRPALRRRFRTSRMYTSLCSQTVHREIRRRNCPLLP